MIRVDGTIDIECADWDRFVVGATYHARARETKTHGSIRDIIRYVTSRGGTWWAHLGGQYDLLAILDELHAQGVTCTIAMSGSRISRIVGGGATWVDSYALIPMALSRAAHIAGEMKIDLDLPCVCSFACGGFCSIGNPAYRAKVRDYCANDARVLYRVLAALVAFADEHRIDLRGTIGGTAWATAQQTLRLPDAEWSPEIWRQTRAAYVGGRVGVFRPSVQLEASSGSHWDISSAYPAALARTYLPVGAPKLYGGGAAQRCLERSVPGLYNATLDIPWAHVPPLPIRTDRGISYPYGEGVTGTWALPELCAAIERGATIQSVNTAITWEPTPVRVFGELVPYWYSLRRFVGKATALGEWLRLLCNSLTGKLAESPERRAVRVYPDEVTVCTGKAPCTLRACTERCGAFRQLDSWGSIWSVPFFRPSPSSHVHWACYLTAATRVAWLEGAETQGDELVYGDTDSIWTTSRRAPGPKGIALGHWELKHTWSSFIAAGPKAYRYVDGADGEAVVRVAGASIVTDDDWNRGNGSIARGVKPLITAAAAMSSTNRLFCRDVKRWALPGGLAGWAARERYGDRALDVASGRTYPPRYGTGSNREESTGAKTGGTRPGKNQEGHGERRRSRVARSVRKRARPNADP